MPEDNMISRRDRLSDYHQRGRELLLAQTRALDDLIDDLNALEAADDREVTHVLLLMLQAVGVSVHSVLALTRERDMAIRDCFGIARSAVETAVNAAFISVAGKPMADKAIRHMRQKRWRDLRREGRVGDLRILYRAKSILRSTTSRDFKTLWMNSRARKVKRFAIGLPKI